jgi:hypothetical protein
MSDVSTSFRRLCGFCALLTGIFSFLFSVTFVSIARTSPSIGAPLSGAFLLLGGFLSTPVFVVLYQQLRESDASFALWALLLSVFGAFGYILLGGYDLAVSRAASGVAVAPNPADPLSLLSFGISGAGVIVFSWIIIRGRQFRVALGYLGYILGVLLILFYAGRLIDDSLSNPLVIVPGVLSGIVVDPVWYIWLGLFLLLRTGRLFGSGSKAE